MIYLADDYVVKYQDTLGYIIGRAIEEQYSPFHVEHAIAYSSSFSLLEKSDVTEIAFYTSEDIYKEAFKISKENNEYDYNPYGIFGWIGYTYIRLFFDLKITFELLFILLPIEKMVYMYKLYHEIDYQHALDEVNESIKYSYLNMIMKRKKISTAKLSTLSGVPFSTISALRYGKRDINKLEASSLLKLSNALCVKMESLLTDINLITD